MSAVMGKDGDIGAQLCHRDVACPRATDGPKVWMFIAPGTTQQGDEAEMSPPCSKRGTKPHFCVLPFPDKGTKSQPPLPRACNPGISLLVGSS